MKTPVISQAIVMIALIILTSLSLNAQESKSLVSPFKGSSLLGTYQARFAPLSLLIEPLDSKKNTGITQVEGALTSHIYKRPEGVSEFEVFSSYKKVLKSADFDLLLLCESNTCNTKQMVKTTYGHPKKELTNRGYSKMPGSTTAYLVGWAQYYISAKKKTADKTYYVMIIISTQKSLYSVDVLETASMEEGSVDLSPEILKTKINDEGKAILQGIYFETGTDLITEKSTPAILAISNYLNSNPGMSFYVVGHTDDSGNTENNISLSKRRANAVIEILKQHNVNTTRLVSFGIGPFSPVSTNKSLDGKSKNRRVELVLRLKQ